MNSILFLMLTIGQASYVSNTASTGSFQLAQGQQTATLYVDSSDWPGVVRAVGDLQSDIARVTNKKPAIASDRAGLTRNMVIAGTVGKSTIIDKSMPLRLPVSGNRFSYRPLRIRFPA
jgi:hypothetical protein